MKRLLILAAALLLIAGCASPNVNPPVARANTGYVDFLADASGEFAWDVQRFDARDDRFTTVFSDLKPVEGGVLRLAFAPGDYRFKVTFLDRVISEPALIEVHVEDGRITPVQVTLEQTGTASVETKAISGGGTVYGRYGRRTKISGSETQSYRLIAAPQPSKPYRAKERMP